MGLVSKKISSGDQRIRTLSLPSPSASGERGGTDVSVQVTIVNDLINHAYIMKPPLKTLKDKVQRASGLVNQWRFRRSGLEGREALRPISIPCPIHLFHLAIPESYLFIINQCSIRLVPKELRFCTFEICHLILEYILKQMWLCYASF